MNILDINEKFGILKKITQPIGGKRFFTTIILPINNLKLYIIHKYMGEYYIKVLGDNKNNIEYIV